MPQIIKTVVFNEDTFCNIAVDKFRTKESMCYHCTNLNIKDPSKNCGLAATFYKLCCEHNAALILTKCKHFNAKQGSLNV